MMDFSSDRLARLSGMLKRRGVILPAFEIHGGIAGLYDFGPVGGRLRNKVIQKWIIKLKAFFKKALKSQASNMRYYGLKKLWHPSYLDS